MDIPWEPQVCVAMPVPLLSLAKGHSWSCKQWKGELCKLTRMRCLTGRWSFVYVTVAGLCCPWVLMLPHRMGVDAGARCVATLLHEMKKRGKDCRFGVVSMCIGEWVTLGTRS